METLKFEEAGKVQTAVSNANDEIAQLKATIVSLREELEKTRIHCEEKINENHRAALDEKKQLRETIQKLREQIEKTHAE